VGLTRTTAPTVEPITRAEAKAHSRVTVSDDDEYIDALIEATRDRIENHTKRALLTQTWRLTLDSFPLGRRDIILPWSPLQSVTSITYVDTNGTTQTWASSNYSVDTGATPGRVRLAYDVLYPSIRHQPNAVTIIFVAGYGSAASDLPAGIVHACKILFGHYYDNREPVVTGTVATPIPETWKALLGPYRVLGAGT
jgi:uncharacterized phiE125 gp8 family phage protein